MGTGEHMDAFISRGMVGQSSTTKDWFKSKDRFEQEIGAKVNRQDRQLTFAVLYRAQDARLTLTHRSFCIETASRFLSLAPAALRRMRRGCAPFETRSGTRGAPPVISEFCSLASRKAGLL
jgi:hypothetical protein